MIITAAAVAAGIIITAVAILTSVAALRKNTMEMKHLIFYRLAINSLLDYTINGVRSKWCFSPTWLPDNNACSLLHPRNVERLLLTDSAISNIVLSMNPTEYTKPIRLTTINQTISLSSISSNHPLYTIVSPLLSHGIYSMTVEIDRIDNINEPGQDAAVPLKIRVTMNTNRYLELLGKQLFAEAKVLVFPRELNTFALLLPNNLYLDGQVASTPYDSSLSGTGAGLRFESPVYVNTNVFVPKNDVTTTSAVTFLDRIILGSGYVYQGTQLYTPASAGGPLDQYTANMPGFGGFLGGVELDVEADKGLYNFAGINQQPIPVDKTLFNLCKLRSMARLDLTMTDYSQLYLKPSNSPAVGATSTAGSSVLAQTSFLLSLGSLDQFQPQVGFVATPNTTAVTAPPPIIDDTHDPIMNVTVNVTGIYDGTPNGSGGYNYAPQQVVYAGQISEVGTMKIPIVDKSGVTIVGEIDIVATPQIVTGDQQSNSVNITVSMSNQSQWAFDKVWNGMSQVDPRIEINIEAYDFAYGVGVNGRASSIPNASRFKTNGVKFAWNSTNQLFAAKPAADGGVSGFYLCSELSVSDCPQPTPASDPTPQEPIDAFDYLAFDVACNGLPPADDAASPAFAGIDWGVSFANQTRDSWGFAPPDMNASPTGFYNGTFLLDQNNSGANPAFLVLSIIKECRVTAQATFVTGFFVCDSFIVEPRGNPLRIVGTVIAKKLTIDSSAITAGIRWSSIHTPSAIYELRQKSILNPGNVACDDPNLPNWSPVLSAQRLQALYKCMPVYLRNKADPFKWTLMDPDCGLPSGGTQYKCKKRVMRFVVKEMSRTGTL